MFNFQRVIRAPPSRKKGSRARRGPPEAARRRGEADDQEGKVMGAVAARRQGDAGAGGKVMRAVPVRRSEGKRETGGCICTNP